MSAAALGLSTVVAPAAPRNGLGQSAGGGDAGEGRSSFDRLIGSSKAAAARSEARMQRAERAGEDAQTEARDPPADAAQDGAVDGSGAGRAASDGEKIGDEAGDKAKAATTPADGSSLLAWLQASTTRASTPAADSDAAAKLGDSADLTRLVGRAALSIAADAAKPAADGLAALAAAVAGDGDTGATKAFHLPLLGAADGREPDKAVVAALDALIAKDAAAPQPAANGAAALAATAFAATTAAAGQDRAGSQAIGLAALPAALQAPLDAQSHELPQQLGERVQWLVGAGLQEARLQLHPRDLGAVMVQVRVEAGSASVFFSAEHPAARAALQAALPQLREQFASGGMQLAQAQVSSQQSGGWGFAGSQTSGGGDRGQQGGAGYTGGEAGDAPLGAVATRVVHIGLLDDYA